MEVDKWGNSPAASRLELAFSCGRLPAGVGGGPCARPALSTTLSPSPCHPAKSNEPWLLSCTGDDVLPSRGLVAIEVKLSRNMG
jgi:hypothetical protein